MISVTERIKEVMDLRGWSCYELSNQADISLNAVYDWFDKGSEPSMQNIIKICTAAHITLEHFFCRGSYKYTKEENAILEEWFALSELEQSVVMKLIEVFQIVKNNR